VTIHTDDVLGGPIDSRGRTQPEEYESYIHETAWAALSRKSYLWGTWLWNAFDFATTIRHEGDADDINTKGLVTYDRKIRKDAWYFYKANWATTPTVHINGRRYVDRAYPVTDVRVYSNGAATEVMLNGRSLGERADCPQRVCVWPAVRLEPGENVLVARARFEGQTVEDRIVWRRPTDANAPIRIDAGSLVGAGKTVKFGSDAFFKGGQALSANTPADYGRPEVRAAITGTQEIDAASSYRQGRFTYAIPLTPGRYSVRLTFVEPKLAAGERRFDVLANGARVLPTWTWPPKPAARSRRWPRRSRPASPIKDYPGVQPDPRRGDRLDDRDHAPASRQASGPSDPLRGLSRHEPGDVAATLAVFGQEAGDHPQAIPGRMSLAELGRPFQPRHLDAERADHRQQEVDPTVRRLIQGPGRFAPALQDLGGALQDRQLPAGIVDRLQHAARLGLDVVPGRHLWLGRIPARGNVGVRAPEYRQGRLARHQGLGMRVAAGHVADQERMRALALEEDRRGRGMEIAPLPRHQQGERMGLDDPGRIFGPIERRHEHGRLGHSASYSAGTSMQIALTSR
jgi:hypothetical protein